MVRYNFSNFNKFEGRANRREYLIFMLVTAVCGGLGTFLDAAFFDEPSVVFMSIFSLPFILPWLAVSTRRCHDIGRRGYFLLLLFVPLINVFVIYLLAYKESQSGPNEFGLTSEAF